MRAPSTLITSLALALSAGASLAQVSDLPPALPAAAQVPATAAPAAPRKPIELPAARPAPEAAPTPKATGGDDGLVPTEAEMADARKHPKPAPDPETRIVEVLRGKQVVEVVVTPGLTQRSYVMENRPERAATPGTDSGTLSVPRFLRLDF